MKGLLLFLLFTIALPCFAQADQGQIDAGELRKRQLELMQRIRKQLEDDQRDMDQFFNDQFFKQADQMFKQLQDDKGPFGQMLQQFQKGLLGNMSDMQAPSQWRESEEGMSFILPYILGSEDKIDLKIKDNEVNIEIIRMPSQGISRTQSYQFTIPKGTDPSAMEILSREKENETHILFPWKKKLEKLRPSSGDKVI